MTGGETSLSGNDDLSLPLQYTPGYEQLYINGVLQVRGQDYTATTGTTVTGLTALVANDVVEIFSAVARTVADVYTQTQSDSRFVNRSVGGLNLVVPTSLTVGSGTGTVSANGSIAFSGASSVSIDGCFTSSFDNYRIMLTTVNDVGTINMRMRQSGTTISADYSYASPTWLSFAGFDGVNRGNDIAQWDIGSTFSTSGSSVDIYRPFVTSQTGMFSINSPAYAGNSCWMRISGGILDNTASMTGFLLFASGGNLTGTLRVYGYNNG
jgi:hypothetical protein